MESTDIFSITDLRKQPATIIERSNQHPQFIFRNNKMVGVIISPSDYDTVFSKTPTVEFHEIKYGEMTDAEREMYEESKTVNTSDFSSYTLADYES